MNLVGLRKIDKTDGVVRRNYITEHTNAMYRFLKYLLYSRNMR